MMTGARSTKKTVRREQNAEAPVMLVKNSIPEDCREYSPGQYINVFHDKAGEWIHLNAMSQMHNPRLEMFPSLYQQLLDAGCTPRQAYYRAEAIVTGDVELI
jgi:hypothetical protein